MKEKLNLRTFISALNSFKSGDNKSLEKCYLLLNDFLNYLDIHTPDYKNIKEKSEVGLEVLKKLEKGKKWDCTIQAALFDAIMAWYRSIYIFVRNSYIRSYETSERMTVNLHDENVKWELSEEDREGTGMDDFTRIYANSFGTFDSSIFFRQDKWPRIMFLLKESYIEIGNFHDWISNPDVGGHDQSLGDNNGYNTIHKAVDYAQTLLMKLFGRTVTQSETLKHMCIINVMAFPGFAFPNCKKSDKTYLRYAWSLFMPLIVELIKFTAPDIVVMGGIHELVHNCSSDVPVIINNIRRQTGELFNGMGFTPDVDCANTKYISGNYIIPTCDNGPIFIQADYPSAPSFRVDSASKDAERILSWRNSHSEKY